MERYWPALAKNLGRSLKVTSAGVKSMPGQRTLVVVVINSRSWVIEALASSKPESLLGVAETSWLDFKSAPYGPADHAKFELCKDVAAFANAQGGLLVYGIAAKKQDDRALEMAEELRPFPRRAANVDRYIDVLNEYLRPRVAVNHYWYPDLHPRFL
jgi:hypothetical protein